LSTCRLRRKNKTRKRWVEKKRERCDLRESDPLAKWKRGKNASQNRKKKYGTKGALLSAEIGALFSRSQTKKAGLNERGRGGNQKAAKKGE